MTNEQLTLEYYDYLVQSIGTVSVLDLISVNGGFENFTKVDGEELKFEISFSDNLHINELEKFIKTKYDENNGTEEG